MLYYKPPRRETNKTKKTRKMRKVFVEFRNSLSQNPWLHQYLGEDKEQRRGVRKGRCFGLLCSLSDVSEFPRWNCRARSSLVLLVLPRTAVGITLLIRSVRVLLVSDAHPFVSFVLFRATLVNNVVISLKYLFKNYVKHVLSQPLSLAFLCFHSCINST